MTKEQKQARIQELRAQLDPLTVVLAIRSSTPRGDRGRAALQELLELEGDK